MAMDRIVHIVDRFLGWRLPVAFNPDGGVSFDREVNGKPRPEAWWPTGTNLLSAEQAAEMVRHMTEGLPENRSDEDLTEALTIASGQDPVIQFFGVAHLQPAMRAISRPFAEQALRMFDTLPRNPERTVAFRKLIEAKDCAVRALIYKGA